MARNEQKSTYSSPLAVLGKPGAMRQEVMPGFPPPRDTSPVSLARLSYILRRGVESITAFRDSLSRRGHRLQTEHVATGYSSSLVIRMFGEEKEALTTQSIKGRVLKLTQQGATAILTNEHGATIKYHHDGSAFGSPTPSRRPAQEKEQDTPWYQRSIEAVGREGIRIENIPASLVDTPTRTNTKRGVPVVRFHVTLEEAPEVELIVDIFDDMNGPHANKRRIERVLHKNLKAGERVNLTGHFHVDSLTGQTQTTAQRYVRRWIRLIDVDRPPAPSQS